MLINEEQEFFMFLKSQSRDLINMAAHCIHRQVTLLTQELGARGWGMLCPLEAVYITEEFIALKIRIIRKAGSQTSVTLMRRPLGACRRDT